VANPSSKYISIIDKHHLKVTDERIKDFKSTLKEIVDLKNGKIPYDSIESIEDGQYQESQKAS
jgi:hypothetical protein